MEKENNVFTGGVDDKIESKVGMSAIAAEREGASQSIKRSAAAVVQGGDKLVYKLLNNPAYIGEYMYKEEAGGFQCLGFFDGSGVEESLRGESELYIGLKGCSKITEGIVSNATFLMPLYLDPEILNTTGFFSVYGITAPESWQNTSISWDNRPACDSTPIAYAKPKFKEKDGKKEYYLEFDVTAAFLKGYTGFAIKGDRLYISNISAYENVVWVPKEKKKDLVSLVVSYKKKTGVRGAKSITQSVSAGNGAIDLFTGAYSFAHEDVKIESTYMPFTLAHVYNSDYYKTVKIGGTDYNCGNGWRLNCLQFLKKVEPEFGSYGDDENFVSYEYTDGTGFTRDISTRYFKTVTVGSGGEAKTYKRYGGYNKDDTELKSEVSDGTYTLTEDESFNILTDAAGNKMRFEKTSPYRLRELELFGSAPKSARTVTFTFESDKITINHCARKTITVYFSYSLLNRIEYNGEVVRSFEYSQAGYNNYVLSKITTPSDVIKMSYNAENGAKLSTITDGAGVSLYYSAKYDGDRLRAKGYSVASYVDSISYDEDEQKGVKRSVKDLKVYESKTIEYDSKLSDETLHMQYNAKNLTAVKDKNGAAAYYCFNADGSVKLTADEEGNFSVSVTEASAEEENGVYKTKVKQVSATTNKYAKVERSEMSGRFLMPCPDGDVGKTSYTKISEPGEYVFIGEARGRISASSYPAEMGSDESFFAVTLTRGVLDEDGINLTQEKIELGKVDYLLSTDETLSVVAVMPFSVKEGETVTEVGFRGHNLATYAYMYNYGIMKAFSYTEAEIFDQDYMLVNSDEAGVKTTVKADVTRRGDGKITTTVKRDGATDEVCSWQMALPSTGYDKPIKTFDGVNLETSYTYDTCGNVTSKIAKDVHTQKSARQTYSYGTTDSTGGAHCLKESTDEAGNKTTYEYDLATRHLSRATTPDGQKIDYAYYGSEGLLKSIKAVANADGFVEETGNELYYNHGYLTRMTSHGAEYLFTYDGAGRILEATVDGKIAAKCAYKSLSLGETKIDGVEKAVEKTTVCYYSEAVNAMTFAGGLFSGIAYATDFVNKKSVVYASYYDKNGNLLAVRRADDKQLDYAFTSADNYITVEEQLNREETELTVTYTIGNEKRVYVYDTFTNKLLSTSVYENESEKVKKEATGRDNFGRIIGTKYTIDGENDISYGFEYFSDYDDGIKTVVLPNGANASRTADGFGRITSKSIAAAGIGESFTYAEKDSYTTPLVAEHCKTHGEEQTRLSYAYDKRGNITSIKDGETLVASYEYDGLGRLKRENDPQGQITVYEYDKSGNISIKRQFPYSEYAAISTKTLVNSNLGTEVKYTYEDDKLKGYNGVVGVTYDYAGNPRKWFKHGANGTECALKLDWKESTLVGITDETANKKYEYTYNADGLRTGKTVDGVKHEYYLSGSKILAETCETCSVKKLFKYYYDDTGVVGFNLDGTDYYFVKSMQGDVEKIYSASGELKAEYSYDSWGKCTIKRSVSGIAEANAFRYRGYYFDGESGLYYLNSRYYDPIIGRFISPDSLDYLDPSALGGLNLYAYCGNNPIMYVDPEGHSFLLACIIIFAVIGLVLGGTILGIRAYQEGLRGWDLALNIGLGALFGGLVGAVFGAFIGLLLPFMLAGGGMAAGIGAGGAAAAAGSGSAVLAGALAGVVVVAGVGVMTKELAALENVRLVRGKGGLPMQNGPKNGMLQNDAGSTAWYDENGNQIKRLDTQGTPHFSKDYGRDLLPHVHVYEWEWIKGAWRIVKRFILPW